MKPTMIRRLESLETHAPRLPPPFPWCAEPHWLEMIAEGEFPFDEEAFGPIPPAWAAFLYWVADELRCGRIQPSLDIEGFLRRFGERICTSAPAGIPAEHRNRVAFLAPEPREEKYPLRDRTT